jgi:hypothetical protein
MFDGHKVQRDSGEDGRVFVDKVPEGFRSFCVPNIYHRGGRGSTRDGLK